MCLIDNIFDEDFDKDWTFYAKQGKPDSAVETVMISEMPKGSEVHLKLKTLVDESLGVEKGQTGCTYPYLVKVVSNALIPYYYANVGQNESMYKQKFEKTDLKSKYYENCNRTFWQIMDCIEVIQEKIQSWG